MRQSAHTMAFRNADSWVILSGIEQRIKEKIERAGTPLKDWDIQINYGIKTGYNEAFIIDGKKKEELIKQDPKSAEIIRPILRGRDIKRYGYEFADLWLIATFPSLKIDIEQYPAVKKHLLSFGMQRLEQTGKEYKIGGQTIKARKKTNNKWFETQDSISYWEDFSKQKIIWGEISDLTKFSIDLDGHFVNEATTFLMTGQSLLYLLGFLNSKISGYFFSRIGTTTGVGTLRWKKYTIEQLLVPSISLYRQAKYEEVVKEIVKRQLDRQNIEDLIKNLESMIYQDLQLNAEEINFIESL